MSLVADHAKRLIQSGDQLVGVLLESLHRLNAKLHDKVVPVKFLWFPSGTGAYRPREEQDLTDYVYIHLDEDLGQRAIIVNREVQIRRGAGRGSGKSTDIHVDAVVPAVESERYERFYAIIEAKGNWNKDLLTAMETQLRNRYLKDLGCQFGIYLVGWFSSSNWDQSDYRKAKCPSMSLAEARSYFEKQARDLSTDGFNLKSYVLDLSLLQTL